MPSAIHPSHPIFPNNRLRTFSQFVRVIEETDMQLQRSMRGATRVCIEFNSSPYFVSILIMKYFALDRKQLNGTHFHTNTSVYGVKVSWTMMMAVKSVQFVCHCLKLRTMLDVCPACISSIWIVWINGWLRTNTVQFVVSISKLGSIKIS